MSTYTDYSQLGEATQQGAALTMSPESFPVKLYTVLAELEATERSFIAGWAPHGRCFKVHDTAALVETVLSCSFRQTQLSSFQRQLNLYGFARITAGPDKHSYYHEFFLRNRPHLACRIRRTPFKGHGPRRAVGPDTQPNFYILPFLPPFSVTHTAPSNVVAPVSSIQPNNLSQTGAVTRVARAAHSVVPTLAHRAYPGLQDRMGHLTSTEGTRRAVDPRLIYDLSTASGPYLSHRVMRHASAEATSQQADLLSLYGPYIANTPPTLAPHTDPEASQIMSFGHFTRAGGAARQTDLLSLFGSSMASAPALQLGSQTLASPPLDTDALTLLLSQHAISEALSQLELGVSGPNSAGYTSLFRDNVTPMTSMAASLSSPLPPTIDPNSLAVDVLSRAHVASSLSTRNDRTAVLDVIQTHNRQLALRQRIRQLEQAREEEETQRLISLALLNRL